MHMVFVIEQYIELMSEWVAKGRKQVSTRASYISFASVVIGILCIYCESSFSFCQSLPNRMELTHLKFKQHLFVCFRVGVLDSSHLLDI